MLVWIIYFWLIAILVAASAIGRGYLYFRSETVKLYDLFESLVSIFAIIGLYGFAYQIPLLSATFWKIIWLLLVLTWLYSIFAAKNEELIENFGMAKASTIIALTSILGVPTLIGLAFYSFRSSNLWDN
jgi:hypothetical protein